MSIADIFQTGERKKDIGHFRNLVLIAQVDNHVDDTELVLLRKIGMHIGLSYTQIGNIMDDPTAHSVIPPFGKDERYEMIIDLIRMVTADGIIDSREEKLLERFAVQVGYKSIDEVEVESIISLIERGEDNDTIITELG
tara:strand:+ start:175 stop:591 length:417 start_codon:yes stop_codon:yes gene_type:complete